MKKVSWSWEKLGHCVKEDKYTFCVDILKMKSFANKEARAPHYIFIKVSHFGIAWYECILLTKKYVSSRYPFETLIVLYTKLILVSLLLIENMRKNGYLNIFRHFEMKVVLMYTIPLLWDKISTEFILLIP